MLFGRLRAVRSRWGMLAITRSLSFTRLVEDDCIKTVAIADKQFAVPAAASGDYWHMLAWFTAL